VPNDSHGGIFTGERLVAGDPLFAADLSRHVVAYRVGQEQVRGKRVLDAGCGDGYGTDLLAQTAGRAVGVDRSAETVAIAARRYQRPNLAYRVCELPRLADLGERFDVVCNFQVIEHLADPQPFLRAAQQVLEPGGCLIVTTPNRLTARVENPYHVHEYVADELHAVLAQVFGAVEVRGVCGDARAMAYETARVERAQRILRLDPLNLRRLIPPRAIAAVYPLLARLVRRGVARSDQSALLVGPENFTINSACDAALDLLAICR
jgi:SAM-dependent methyltransferase